MPATRNAAALPLIVLLAAGIPSGVEAQWWLGSDAGLAGRAPSSRSLTSGPAMGLRAGYDGGGWSLTGAGSLAESGDQWASVIAGKRMPLGPFVIGASLGIDYRSTEVLRDSYRGSGDLSLALRRRGWGVWLGYAGAWQGGGGSDDLPAFEADSNSAPLESLDPTDYRGWFTGGAWRQVGSLLLAASLVSQRIRTERRIINSPQPDSLGPLPDSLGLSDGSVVLGHDRLADLELSASWYHGPLSLAVIAGARLAGNSELWGGVESTVRVYRDLALVGRAGRRPDFSRQGITGESYLFAGVRLSTKPFRPGGSSPVTASVNGFELMRTTTGSYRVVVSVPGARAVDFMGDATDWTALSLRQVTADRWTADLEFDQGPQRMVIRVDGGAWQPPPGLTAIDDDFFGQVGLVVVP